MLARSIAGPRASASRALAAELTLTTSRLAFFLLARGLLMGLTGRVRLVRIPKSLTAVQKNALFAGSSRLEEEPIKLTPRNSVSGDSHVEFYSPHRVSLRS